MARYIDADEFRREMYHEAFETDSDLQKWDSGCWIRYKMFENAIENFPSVDAVPVVRCGECRHKYLEHDVWMCRFGLLIPSPDGFCSYGEKVAE